VKGNTVVIHMYTYGVCVVPIIVIYIHHEFDISNSGMNIYDFHKVLSWVSAHAYSQLAKCSNWSML